MAFVVRELLRFVQVSRIVPADGKYQNLGFCGISKLIQCVRLVYELPFRYAVKMARVDNSPVIRSVL